MNGAIDSQMAGYFGRARLLVRCCGQSASICCFRSAVVGLSSKAAVSVKIVHKWIAGDPQRIRPIGYELPVDQSGVGPPQIYAEESCNVEVPRRSNVPQRGGG